MHFDSPTFTSWLPGARAKSTMVSREDALPGRAHRPFTVPATHEVLGNLGESPGGSNRR